MTCWHGASPATMQPRPSIQADQTFRCATRTTTAPLRIDRALSALRATSATVLVMIVILTPDGRAPMDASDHSWLAGRPLAPSLSVSPDPHRRAPRAGLAASDRGGGDVWNSSDPADSVDAAGFFEVSGVLLGSKGQVMQTNRKN